MSATCRTRVSRCSSLARPREACRLWLFSPLLFMYVACEWLLWPARLECVCPYAEFRVVSCRVVSRVTAISQCVIKS